jgi:MtN3 and saliva related transmembrane protein
MDLTNAIGWCAMAVGTSLMVPQVIRAMRTRKMEDVSWGTVIAYVLNCALWLWYGIRLKTPPMNVANGIGLVISMIQVRLKWKFG